VTWSDAAPVAGPPARSGPRRPGPSSTARPPDPAALDRPWTRTYPPGVPASYQLPAVPVTRLLDDAVRDFPHGTGLASDRVDLDHATIRDRVEELASLLHTRGVVSGDRVVVALPNLVTLPLALLAAWRLGAIAVPLDPELRAERVSEVVAEVEPRTWIGSRRALRRLEAGPGAPAALLEVDDDAWLGPGRRWHVRTPRWLSRSATRWRRRRHADGGSGQGVPVLERLDDAMGGVRDRAVTRPSRVVDPGSAALLRYHAETPEARGVVLTHRNLVAAAFQARLWVPDVQAGRERFVVAAAMHDPVALVLGWLAGLLSGAGVVVDDGEDLAATIDRQRPTLTVARSAQLGRLLEDGADKRDLGSLRVVLGVGEPVVPQVALDLERRTGGARVRSAYGLLDAGAMSHAQPVYGRVTPGTIGLPVTGTVAVVVDPADLGVLCAPDVPGRLLVHGPQVASGYWGGPAAERSRFVDGWVVTDDLASMDEQGVFTHVGHADEVVARAGAWLSPRRIEAVLERHPAVRRAGVVGLAGPLPEVDGDATPAPDAAGDPGRPRGDAMATAGGDDGQEPSTAPPIGLTGRVAAAGEPGGEQRLVAAVVCRRWGRPSPEELLEHCAAHLDSPAVPDLVTLVDELPETATGDLARARLREELTER
jgi:long-chain acyl-CoA synthetase